MAKFRNYNTFLNYAYFNLCCRESQVIFTVSTNHSKDLNINRTAVYAGNVMLPKNLVYWDCLHLCEGSNKPKRKFTLIFKGVAEETEFIRLKLVFSDSSFFDFDCYRNETDVYTISEVQ